MGEQTFFEKDGVTVTTARFIVDNKTHAMRGVTSVSMTSKPRKLGVPIVCGILSALAFLPTDSNTGQASTAPIGVLFFLIALVSLMRAKSRYGVTLQTAAGEVTALESGDRKHVERIYASLNRAIVEHNRGGE